MGTSENVFAICESLRALGYGVADSKIQEALAHLSLIHI